MSAAVAAVALALAGAVAERQHAPLDGWAAQEGGTRGGAMAPPAHVYTVRSPDELLAALRAPAPARIVRVAASIDMRAGRPFGDTEDQARRGLVRIPSNTTLLGVTPGAGFVNASLQVSGVSQVIVRNLALRNPCDVEPQWDAHDGARGNWNARYDGISVSNAHHVWIDHNSFTDAPVTDDTQPVANGMPKQCHDGALDITNGADFVSVTYNRFALHEKNTLVGGSDRAVGDRGRLRVTFKANLFEHVSERAPRVRYGQVHLFNNYHVGDRRHPVYPHAYSVGAGVEARIVSHANAYAIAGASTCAHVVRAPGAGAGAGSGIHADEGSTLNGQPLSGCAHGGDAGWRAPYRFDALPAHAVAQHVLAYAGPRPPAGEDGVVDARLIVGAGEAPFVLQAWRAAPDRWQGASVRAIDGGATLQVELLEARGGAPVRLKGVRRRAPLAGAPLVLRVQRQAGALSAWLDGESVTSARVAPLAAREPAAWEAAGHTLLDLREAPAALPFPPIAPRLGSPILLLQARDAPERIAVGAAAATVESSDARIASASLANGHVLVTPHRPGRAIVTVGGADRPWEQATFAVAVGQPFAGPARTTLPAARLWPAHAERGVPPDTPLRMTFMRAPVLSGAGSMRVVRRHDGVVVATIRPGETVIALGLPGRQRHVRHHAIEVEGKALRARLPLKLDHGVEYEVVVDPALLRDQEFKGARWRFRTTPYRPVGDSVTVDDDGRADFRTVQGAFDHAMTLPRASPVTVHVRDGVYPELLYLHDKDRLTLRGQSREATIIRAANSDARNPGSAGRALFLAEGSDLLDIRDLTLHNTTRRSSGQSAQAETLFFSNDNGRFSARNAAFLSEQDTLQLTGYAWFYRSLVEGNVDFIWGHNRAALFEECTIRSVGDSASRENGGYLVQARTVERHDPGFVFLRSRLTQGPGQAGNRPPPASVFLARSPGTPHTWDNVAFIGNTVEGHVAASGWLRQPAPNPASGDAASGWREHGNTTPDGAPLTFGGYTMGADEVRALSTRGAVFGRFDGGRGWDPQS